jgi:hypothetical protein
MFSTKEVPLSDYIRTPEQAVNNNGTIWNFRRVRASEIP